MNAEYISHVGAVREKNEDAVFCDKKAGLFAVADGLGGHLAGEVASATAVRILAETFWRTHEEDAALVLREAFYEANSVLHEAGKAAEMAGMGTTMTAAAARGDTLHIAHVGDSRVYLLRGESIMRLTVDHTLVEEMVMKGLITRSAAKVHPKRNYITRALGTGDQVEVDLTQVEVQPGDILFLCTDGLSNHVKEQFILETGRAEGSWQDKLETLVQTAMANGSTDNITAMFAVFEDHTEDNK